MSTTLIIPACGQSARFPNMRPKWLLTHPDGKAMIVKAIEGLDLSEVDNIYIAVLKEHDDKYGFNHGIADQLKRLDNIANAQCGVWFSYSLKPTKSQVETIANLIEHEDLEGPIFIKDTDNYFNFKPSSSLNNYVTVASLNDLQLVNPSNKSYVMVNDKNVVTNIVEKTVISNKFCCGGYGFASALDFLGCHHVKPNIEYISQIILEMMYKDRVFTAHSVSNYKDWGTLEDWQRDKQQYQTLFIDLDGVLVENSAEYMEPKWGTTKGIQANIDKINELFDSGKAHIVITTARSEDHYDHITINQLKRLGIKYHNVVFNCYPRRTVINDYAPPNPYPSCEAINIPRNGNIP